MNKIRLIIEREYLTRVRKKSFIIMTFLGPLLMALTIILPVWLTTIEEDDDKLIGIIDKTETFQSIIEDTNAMKFEFLPSDTNLDDFKADFDNSGYYAIVEIPDFDANENAEIQIYSDIQPSLNVKIYIQNIVEHELEDQKIVEQGIDDEIINSLDVDIKVNTTQWTDDGGEKIGSPEIAMAIGFISSFMVYIFIFIYGTQVMRGVIEEKTGRVVEIIISSVKPFELMMGKIVGIALVVLTQFSLWVILTLVITIVGKMFLMPDIELSSNGMQDMIQQQMQNGTMPTEFSTTILPAFFNMPFATIIGSFIFYFIGGYLLYAAFFAAIGSAVDNESDTQQFILPVTIPLILSIVMAQLIMQNPDGTVAFWLSMIPLTSPVIMVIRIPFDSVPMWQLVLSMSLLVITFIGATWMAAKIYRTGILMYGKKINYRELWKWLRY